MSKKPESKTLDSAFSRKSFRFLPCYFRSFSAISTEKCGNNPEPSPKKETFKFYSPTFPLNQPLAVIFSQRDMHSFFCKATIKQFPWSAFKVVSSSRVKVYFCIERPSKEPMSNTIYGISFEKTIANNKVKKVFSTALNFEIFVVVTLDYVCDL